jgi:uncharacterized protein YbcI
MSHEQGETGTATAADPTSRLAELSKEMVRLYKEQFGRGPTKARTNYAGPDTVICTLEDTFTPAERRLAEMGEHQRLRDTRLYFQHASENEFREAAERILQRRVRAFISGVDTERDLSSEIFYLVREERSAGGDGHSPPPEDLEQDPAYEPKEPFKGIKGG